MEAKEIIEILLLNDGDLKITQYFDPDYQNWTVEFDMPNGVITKSGNSLDECVDYCHNVYLKDKTRRNNYETN